MSLWIVKRSRFLTETLISVEFKSFDRLVPACFSGPMLETNFREIKKPIWSIVIVRVRGSDIFETDFLLTN
ncbi:hypothetical protein AQ870_00385 [Burkholderia pseudomallei]|nr:hypothetical protein AQ721_18985 [Burkholderia pseudomallei]OMZ82850.1 hypothetical protein AQ870_00385 [Burkholderia pseudomallei]